MKRTLIIAILLMALNYNLYAQGRYISITPTYQPMTQQELILYAYAQAAKKEQFEIYKAKAYECLQVLDYSGFIYYSDYALSFDWYNAKLYYDRGQSYEKMDEYRKAKKEYRKAINTGYSPARQALKQCKENYKKWKNNR